MEPLFGAEDVPWSKLVDLGVSAAALIVLVFTMVKVVIPKYLEQQQSLLAALMKVQQEEAEKARQTVERLMAQINASSLDERKTNRESFAMVVDEWRRTREQLHADASQLFSKLEEIAHMPERLRHGEQSDLQRRGVSG